MFVYTLHRVFFFFHPKFRQLETFRSVRLSSCSVRFTWSVDEEEEKLVSSKFEKYTNTRNKKTNKNKRKLKIYIFNKQFEGKAVS